MDSNTPNSPDEAALRSLREALASRPDDAGAAERLLEAYISFFHAAVAAWPEGLLVGGKRADLAQAERMHDAVRHARTLDAGNLHADFLEAMEVKIRIEI